MTGPKAKGGPSANRETTSEVARLARARDAELAAVDLEEILRRGKLADPTVVASRRACIKGLMLAGRTQRGKLAAPLAGVWGLAVNTVEGDIVEVARNIAEQDADAVRDTMHAGLQEVLGMARSARGMLFDMLFGDRPSMVPTSPRELKEASEAIKNILDMTVNALENLGKTHGVIQANQAAVSVSFKLEVGGSKLELTKGQIGSALQMVAESYGEACGELLSPEVTARVMALAGEKMARRSAEEGT